MCSTSECTRSYTGTRRDRLSSAWGYARQACKTAAHQGRTATQAGTWEQPSSYRADHHDIYWTEREASYSIDALKHPLRSARYWTQARKRNEPLRASPSTPVCPHLERYLTIGASPSPYRRSYPAHALPCVPLRRLVPVGVLYAPHLPPQLRSPGGQGLQA